MSMQPPDRRDYPPRLIDRARQRAIEQELAAHRDTRRNSNVAAAVCLVLAGVLFLSTLAPPADWAYGEWLRPGGLLYERFGADGAVAVVRLALAGVVLLAAWWLLSGTRDLRRGLPKQRDAIARRLPR